MSRVILTPEQFKKQMQAIFDNEGFDKELAHMDADEFMCDVLTSLGYGEGVEIFKSAPKWYA